ncbi:MAG: hypothetical protein Q9227_003799 [Pyrenula ochraceoflavens]
MPQDESSNEDSEAHANGQAQKPSNTTASTLQRKSLFSVPDPIKRIFDSFPFVTYSPNISPARAPQRRQRDVLYIFSTEQGALQGYPSFNPTCLKWQALLTFHSIPHTLRSSTNHASPTGALPFLLPSPTPACTNPGPISSSKLPKHFSLPPPVSAPDVSRHAAYETLLTHAIRPAYLYALYLCATNSRLVSTLYIEPCTNSAPVRTALSVSLRKAAYNEIVKSSSSLGLSGLIDPEELFANARRAFEALETLLIQSSSGWFFGSEGPEEMDANVWAYTYVILGGNGRTKQGRGWQWQDSRLSGDLKNCNRLTEHAVRCEEVFWRERGKMGLVD